MTANSSREHPASRLESLLNEVNACPAAEASSHIAAWRERLEAIWPLGVYFEDCWELMVNQLPLANDAKRWPEAKDYPALIRREPEDHRSMDLFLCCCAHLHIGQYSWSNKISGEAYRFVAGCVNLANLVRRFKLTPNVDSVVCSLSKSIAAYWPTLVRISSAHPGAVRRLEDAWELSDTLALYPTADNVDESSLRAAIDPRDSHVKPETIDFLAFLVGEDTQFALRAIVPALLQKELPWETKQVLTTYWYDNPMISGAFHAQASSDDNVKGSLLSVHPHYLCPGDAFSFCWQVVFSQKRSWQGNMEYLFGATLESRIKVLRELLLETAPKAQVVLLEDRDREKSVRWRTWFFDLFRMIGSLTNQDRWHQRLDENWVRQSEVIRLLKSEPTRMPDVIAGIVDKGHGFYDLLDPIILGLPVETTADCLEKYAASHKDSTDEYTHALCLLAHLRGEIPVTAVRGQATGLLHAVETLITTSRTRIPDQRSQTWLGDIGIESLWYGAIQNSIKEFNAYMETQYGQDEHEHAGVLADALARNLNGVNAIATEWLRAKQISPVSMRVSVRRFPKRAPRGYSQEGGPQGLQADLGFLVVYDIPDQMKTQRITLIQAKKLKLSKTNVWASGFPFRGDDLRQLDDLLGISPHGHYLFFLHPSLGATPLFLPAKTTRDSCQSNRSRTLPLNVVRNGGKEAAAFLLYDIIGLWTGDDSKDLVQSGNSGAEVHQSPRTMVEIHIGVNQD